MPVAGKPRRLVWNLSLRSAVVSVTYLNLLSHPRQRIFTVRLIPILLALFFTTAALADDWKEYANRDYSFIVNFPRAPTVEATTYRASDGRSFPAHIFLVKQETGEFKVTVVDMPGEKAGSDASVIKEASKVAAGDGTVKFDALHRVRAGVGRQLGIAGANGGYSYVALFYRNNHLYQIEGNVFVAGGQAEVDAMRFQQSFDLT
jgi:hypothetical protein